MNIRNIKIINKLLFAIIPLLIIMPIIVLYTFYNHSAEGLNSAMLDKAKNKSHLIQKLIKEYQVRAIEIASVFAYSDEIKKAYYLKDENKGRQLLDKIISPKVESIKRNSNIDNFRLHFHKAPAKSFLRQWNKTGGDDLSSFRFTLLHVYKTKKPLMAIEIGKGGFAIRGIVPILDQNKYLGSVEFFFEPFDIIPFLTDGKDVGIKRDTGVILLVSEDEIKQLSFKEEIKKYFSGRIGSMMISKKSEKWIEPKTMLKIDSINKVIESSKIQIDQNDNIFASYIPISDFSKKIVGLMVIIDDVSNENKKSKKTLIDTISYLMIIEIIIIVFIIFSIRIIISDPIQDIIIKIREIISDKDDEDSKNSHHNDEVQELNYYLKILENAIQKEKEFNQLKSEFTTNVNHELKTPLTSIIMTVKFIKKRIETLDKEQLSQRIDRIDISSKKLHELVNEILNLSRLDKNQIDCQIEDINIKQLVEDLEETYTDLFYEKGLDWKIDISEELTVQTDYNHVYMIINNLLSNSLKFSDEGFVELKITKNTDNFIIQVEDSGVGIPADKRESIFERFFQLGNIDNKAPGTGIGLHMVKRLTEKHGGKVEVSGDFTKGAIFKVIIPLKSKWHDNN